MDQENSSSLSTDTESDEKEDMIQENDQQSKIVVDTLLALFSNSKSNVHEDNIHNSATVSNSGNSTIDIKLHIDFTTIAFAVLYSLYASKLLSYEELDTALRKLQELNKS